MKKLHTVLVLVLAAVYAATCDDSEIDRVCGSDMDIDCIKKYLSRSGAGTPVTEPNENPSYDLPFPQYLPLINASVVDLASSSYSNLNGVIEQFYKNKTSGHLIFSVNFPNLHCDSESAALILSKTEREPKILTKRITQTFPRTVITAIIEESEDGITVESLSKANISAYLPDSNIALSLTFEPELDADDDGQDVIEAFEIVKKNNFTVIKEIMLQKATYLFFMYLQNYICDFGVKPNIQYENFDQTVINRVLEHQNDEPSTSELCAQSDDVTNCVRDFYEKNARCKVIRQADDKPLYRPQYAVYTPWINLTAVVNNANVTGLNGTIKKFYINKQSNNLITTVSFKAIRMNAPLVPLYIHQRGREPKVVTDYNIDVYPVDLNIVTPLPSKDDDAIITSETVKKSFATAYFPGPNVDFHVGPHQAENEDPEVATIIDKLAADPQTHAKEMFVDEAMRYYKAYLQKYICDFSLPI